MLSLQQNYYITLALLNFLKPGYFSWKMSGILSELSLNSSHYSSFLERVGTPYLKRSVRIYILVMNGSYSLWNLKREMYASFAVIRWEFLKAVILQETHSHETVLIVMFSKKVGSQVAIVLCKTWKEDSPVKWTRELEGSWFNYYGFIMFKVM